MLGSKFFLKNEEMLEFCMLRITTKRILKNRIVGLFPQGGPTVSLLPWTRHWPVCSGKGSWACWTLNVLSLSAGRKRSLGEISILQKAIEGKVLIKEAYISHFLEGLQS